MIRADLITESSSTTSMAVRTSRAPQTQKYCPLASSCVATSCISSLSVFLGDPDDSGVCSSVNPGRHQINQRENKHPDQIHKVPVQARDFHIMRVVVLWLEKENDRSDDQPKEQRVNAVMEDIVRRDQEVS